MKHLTRAKMPLKRRYNTPQTRQDAPATLVLAALLGGLRALLRRRRE